MSYFTFRLISVAVIVVIGLLMILSRSSDKEEKGEKPKNAPNEDTPDKNEPSDDLTQYSRVALSRFEYMWIPIMVEEIKKNPQRMSQLYDTRMWESGDIESILNVPRNSIYWADFSCEILGDTESECMIVYEFPKPSLLLAKYGAVYINKQSQIYRYFTLELSTEGYMLGYRIKQDYYTYGHKDYSTVEEFVKDICNLLGIEDIALQKRTVIKSKEKFKDSEHFEKLTDDNYYEFVADNQYAVVCFYDFHWPSIMLSPILAQLAAEYKGKIKVGIYNVYGDDNEIVRESNNIMELPTLLFYKNGVEIKKAVGIITQKNLSACFEECLNTQR